MEAKQIIDIIWDIMLDDVGLKFAEECETEKYRVRLSGALG